MFCSVFCPGESDISGAGSRGSRTELTEIWARLETVRLQSTLETTDSTHHSTTGLLLSGLCQGSAHTFGLLRSENSDSRHPNIICNTQTIQTNARIITHLQILAINTRPDWVGTQPSIGLEISQINKRIDKDSLSTLHSVPRAVRSSHNKLI